MKKTVLTLLLSIPLFAGAVLCQEGTYRTHDELIAMFRNECDKFPGQTSYESIGKTVLNNDIWAFRFGNPKGGKVIIDGCLHGQEDMGSEIAFIWAKWLLGSNDPQAKKFMKENCFIVIPVINYDKYLRGNMNLTVCEGGVDLNRNFVRDWEFVPECQGDYGTSHGASAGSEVETKAIRAFMEANKPLGKRKAVYINTHLGGGPWIHYDGSDIDEYYTPLRNRIIDLWNSNNIVLKNVSLNNFLPPVQKKASKGGESGDATVFGYKAFTIEVLNLNCINGHRYAPADIACTGGIGWVMPSYEFIEKELYPLYKQFFIAVNESVAKKGK